MKEQHTEFQEPIENPLRTFLIDQKGTEYSYDYVSELAGKLSRIMKPRSVVMILAENNIDSISCLFSFFIK